MLSRVAAEVEIKGQAFLGILGALGEMRGDEAVSRVRREVDGELGDALRTNTILSSGWYPVAWYRGLHHAARRVAGGDDAFTIELGRVSLRRDVNLVYRAIFRLLSPTTLLDQSDRIVKLFVRGGGRYETLEKKPGFVRSRYDGFAGFDRILWLDFLGGGHGALELCGARNVVGRIAGGGRDGDAWMVVEATFG
jgi:hypothetical protein